MHDFSIHKYFSIRRLSVNKANKAGRLRLNFKNNPPCGPNENKKKELCIPSMAGETKYSYVF